MAIEVDLTEFLRTGEFGPLRLGTARETFVALMDNPENCHQGRKDRFPTIYKCGDFEFHFTISSGVLSLIFTDWFTVPTGDRSLRVLRTWLHRGMTLPEAEEDLTREGIEFEQNWGPMQQTTVLTTSGGVVLGFDWESGEGRLFAISYQQQPEAV
jgi:hypothetical protein